MSLNLQSDVSLKAFNSFGVEVRARHFAAAHNDDEVREALRLAGQQVGFVHPELAFSVFPQACAVDGDGVHVKPGELYVVPRGVEHRTAAETETKLMMIEPRGVLNTGHEGGERTAVNDVWI